jgi:hypothetical protein
MLHLAIVALLLLAGAPALGQPRAAADCPALFGNARTRAIGAARRAKNIEFIDEDASGVTLAHSSEDWDEPWSLQLVGLELVALKGEVALFEATPSLAKSVGCSAGRYRVTVDDALSRDARVLAVLRESVLVEMRGALRYVLLRGAEHPEWLVAYRLPGTLGPTYDPSAPAPHYESHTIY